MVSKRHHIVSKFYLNNFAFNGSEQVWAHDRRKNKPFINGTINCSVKNHYYSYELNNGNKDTIIEDIFSDVESKASIIINGIINDSIKLVGENRDILIYFITLMKLRNPNFRDSVHDFEERTTKLMYSMLKSDHNLQTGQLHSQKDGSATVEINFKEFEKYTNNPSGYKFNIHPNSSLEMIFSTADGIYPKLRKMNWYIMKNTDDIGFITSDNPIGMCNPKIAAGQPLGIGMKHIEIYFPLSPKHCLIGTWQSLKEVPEPIMLPDFQVMEVNKTILVNTNYCFYSNKECEQLFEEFKKIKGNKKE